MEKSCPTKELRVSFVDASKLAASIMEANKRFSTVEPLEKELGLDIARLTPSKIPCHMFRSSFADSHDLTIVSDVMREGWSDGLPVCDTPWSTPRTSFFVQRAAARESMMDITDSSPPPRDTDWVYGTSKYANGTMIDDTPTSHPQSSGRYSFQKQRSGSSNFGPQSAAASFPIPVPSNHDPLSPSDEAYGGANNEYHRYSEPSPSSSRFQKTSDFNPWYSIPPSGDERGPAEGSTLGPCKQEPQTKPNRPSMGVVPMPPLIELEQHELPEQACMVRRLTGAQRLSLEGRIHQQHDFQDTAGLEKTQKELEKTQHQLQETQQQLLQLLQQQKWLQETQQHQRLQQQERHEQAQLRIQQHQEHQQVHLQQIQEQERQEQEQQQNQLRQEQDRQDFDKEEQDQDQEQAPNEEQERDSEQGAGGVRKTNRRGGVKHKKKFLQANDTNAAKRSAPGSKFLCAFIIGIPQCRNFQVSKKIIGRGGAKTKFISELCPGTKIRLRGKGSGFREPNTNAESNIPLQVNLSSPSFEEYEAAKREMSHLLNTIYAEYREITGKVFRIKLNEHPRNPKMEPQGQYATI